MQMCMRNLNFGIIYYTLSLNTALFPSLLLERQRLPLSTPQPEEPSVMVWQQGIENWKAKQERSESHKARINFTKKQTIPPFLLWIMSLMMMINPTVLSFFYFIYSIESLPSIIVIQCSCHNCKHL